MFIETGIRKDKKIKITYYQDTQIFCKEYCSSISLNEIKESWNYCIEHDLIPQNCIGILLDYRDASFEMNLREIFDLAEFYDTKLNRINQKKVAILTERPDQIVIPTLLSQKSKRFNIRIFTNLRPSISWIKAS